MKYRLIFLIISLGFSIYSAKGQYYDTGQDPASVKWLQIKTDRFTIIYPESYREGGKAFAQSLDDAYAKLNTLFPERKKRIPVIIHSLSTQSNGSVIWAPKRMEIYPTPEQNTIPMDMDKQLAIHELTHVFQMESLNQGFSKGLSFFLGEQTSGIIASLLPFWFLEGDAVFAETYLSGSGRGRSASFQKEVKALTLSKDGFYKYDKILNDSYKNYIPSYYQYGYQMVTWAALKHDPSIWNKVLDFTAKEPFTLNPVNISLSKNAGLSKKKLYNEAFDSLKTVWTSEQNKSRFDEFETMNPDKKGKFVNYYSPVCSGLDSIIAIKTSLSDPPSFVLINPSTKKEVRIHSPGQMYPWLLSAGGGKVVWVETEPDLRWENRDYSVIKILDIKAGVTRKLTRKSRYLSASVSPDGKTICAVENSINNVNNLVLIDAQSGDKVYASPAPGNSYLQHPQWSADGKKITVILLTEEKEGIMSFSVDEKRWESLVDPGPADLQSSLLKNDSLYYISSESGTDNIFMKTGNKETISVTNSRFGTENLSLNRNMLIFSDYSSDGNNIAFTRLNRPSAAKPVDINSTSFLISRFDSEKKVNGNPVLNTYIPEPYKKWQHPFRFHSWMPFYADLEQIKSDPAAVRPGVTILTQNSLSTLVSTIGYEYTADKNNVFHSRVTWKGQYPVIESQLDYGYFPTIYKTGVNVGDPAKIHYGMRFSNSISVPLTISSGKFTEYFRPSVNWDFNNRYIYLPESGYYDPGQSFISGRLYFSNYQRSAYRDIYSRWAQVVDLNYTFAPFDKAIYGTAISLKTAFYFPGILPNNGIKLRFEKESQDPSKYLYGSRISFPRGYNNILSKQLSFLSVDYVMPLIYPDLNISSFLYLKRIRSVYFYDWASGTGNYYYNIIVNGNSTTNYHGYNETFRSYGIELYADFHLLRIPYMISGGVQSVWKDLNSTPTISLLFSIDLFGMKIGKSEM